MKSKIQNKLLMTLLYKSSLLLFFFPMIVFAQVGINTTAPKAALDVESTNNGVLIPRVQLTSILDNTTIINPNTGPLITSTLVYNMAPAGVVPNNVIPGFYYWNGSQWVSISGSAISDHDWYEQGTTTSPNTITDNMFHIGNVAIGKNIANFPLDIETTTNATAFKNSNLSNTSGITKIGIDNLVQTTSTDSNIGIRNEVIASNSLNTNFGIQSTISGSNEKKGISSALTHTSGSQNQTGIESTINSTASTSDPFIYNFNGSITDNSRGYLFGLNNVITKTNTAGTVTGNKNRILANSTVNIGTENELFLSGNGVAYGAKNYIFSSGDGIIYGIKNDITNTGTDIKYGVYSDLSTSNGADIYGNYNVLQTGNQSRYGSYNVINNGAGFGYNYGVYSRVLTSGFENYAGYFLGDVAIGRTDSNKYILPQTRGTNGQIMQTDGTGNVTWQSPNNSFWSLNGNAGTNATTLFGGTFATNDNYIGTSDYIDLFIGTNNRPLLKMSAFGNIGIGIDNPTAKFHIFDNSPYISSFINKRNLSGGLGGTSYVSPNLVVITTSTGGGTNEIYTNSEFVANGVNSATNVAGFFSASQAANNYAIIVPPSSGNIGFGTSTPTTKLHISNPTSGAIRIEDGTQANGNVLLSDANGVGTWQNPNTFAWSLTGNTINAVTNFLGSTNNADVVFRRSNVRAGSIAQFNTSLGVNAMVSLTTGTQNVAIGTNALDSNIISGGNTAVGYDALQSTTGDYNTAYGNSALFSLAAGTSNCAFGYNALNNQTSGINNIGIGTGANVPFSTGNNQIRMGNTAIAYAGIQVAWSVTSDSRWKSDIQKSNLGLNFIKKLNPVSYIRKNDESKKTEYGFIAQELDKTLNDFGAINNGIITKDDEGMLSVRYNDLLAPMVKAIQELTEENDKLKAKNEDLEKRLEKIEEKLNK